MAGASNSSVRRATLATPRIRRIHFIRACPTSSAFAFFGPGQDPHRASLNQLPQLQLSGGNVVYSFSQPAGVSGITYGAEWSAALDSGNRTAIPDTGTGSVHTFSVPIAGNPTTLFIRSIVLRILELQSLIGPPPSVARCGRRGGTTTDWR